MVVTTGGRQPARDRLLRSPFLQQAEVAQALGGLNDRGLGWAWAPSELLLGALVVDD
jgi:hypothetical protein